MARLCLLVALLTVLCAPAVLAKKKGAQLESRKVGKTDGPVHLIRLTNDDGDGRGRVEVFPTKDFRYQSWMPFCDRGFSEDDAATMCSLLGYKFGRKYYTIAANYPGAEDASAPRRLQDLNCVDRSMRSGRGRKLRGVDDERDSLWSVLAASGSAEHPEQPRTAASDSGSRSGSSTAAQAARDLAVVGSGSGSGSGIDGAGARSGRSLLAVDENGEYVPWLPVQPLQGTIDASVRRARQCGFRTSNLCGPDGPFAAVECSGKPFTTPATVAVPMPSPPPPPPEKSESIRFWSGAVDTSASASLALAGVVEANLCDPAASADCIIYGRAELLVPHPDDPSQQVWAPLCSVDVEAYPNLAGQVAQKACAMLWDYPASRSAGVFSVSSYTGAPFALPPAGSAVAADGFDPAAHAFWAQLPEPDLSSEAFPGEAAAAQALTAGKRLVQDVPGLRVSAERCASGALFAFRCDLVVAGRRRSGR
ncbi:hypothetical protein CHLRE_06g296300v5 [Chlamydomonas reinhardtii]|uniref:SRCR domain-containing protein n=1 Tax=Chlamydomonas reinhardtii TaxID=3055 RepID=A0A2K3DQL7_CHLRE|nr:uncharacterized protein CHLRE_06g296300v5 [Chlamydomonas reinhardtii]PNW82831.1 hypothetical protein CHLRE_06g296300v5 [Chlamydomonas reinhardtii]